MNEMTNDISLFDNSDQALKIARKENAKSKDHPSFLLYKVFLTGKTKIIARLSRDFGSSKLYWKQI